MALGCKPIQPGRIFVHNLPFVLFRNALELTGNEFLGMGEGRSLVRVVGGPQRKKRTFLNEVTDVTIRFLLVGSITKNRQIS